MIELYFYSKYSFRLSNFSGNIIILLNPIFNKTIFIGHILTYKIVYAALSVTIESCKQTKILISKYIDNKRQ